MHIPSFKLISQSTLKKSPENSEGRTDGQTDRHCHSIIRPFFKRAYKKVWQTDRRTDGQTDWTIHRAAWSQLKILLKKKTWFSFICLIHNGQIYILKFCVTSPVICWWHQSNCLFQQTRSRLLFWGRYQSGIISNQKENLIILMMSAVAQQSQTPYYGFFSGCQISFI